MSIISASRFWNNLLTLVIILTFFFLLWSKSKNQSMKERHQALLLSGNPLKLKLLKLLLEKLLLILIFSFYKDETTAQAITIRAIEAKEADLSGKKKLSGKALIWFHASLSLNC